jgi:hypothetical protein
MGGVIAYMSIPFKINRVYSTFIGVMTEDENLSEINDEEDEKLDSVEEEDEEGLNKNLYFASQEEEDDYRDAYPGPIKIYPTISPGRNIFSKKDWKNLKEHNLNAIEELK